MSAIHSGRLVDNVSNALGVLGIAPNRVHFVTIFRLGHPGPGQEVPSLRDLSDTQDFQPKLLSSDESDPKFVPIEIDDSVYFPLKYHDIEYPIRITEVMKRNKAFFDEYRHPTLARVHRDVMDDGATRHHAVWIDTEVLVEEKAFREKFRQLILSLRPHPELIITPLHKTPKRLGELALLILSEVPSEPVHLTHPNLFLQEDPFTSDADIAAAIDGTSEDGAILILDDAFITGSRLSSYQKHLRYRTYDGRVHYIVALARPSSLRDWEIFCKRLSFRPYKEGLKRDDHTVQSVETILLPDWDQYGCPWCRETQIYRAANISPAITEPCIQARIELLQRGKSEGLTNDIFFQPTGLRGLQLTKGSIFVTLPASQAAVFAAVAGAIQELRTIPEEKRQASLGPRRFPLATVLAYKEYLSDTYTDSILRASILRGAEREELVYTSEKTEAMRLRAARKLLLSKALTEIDLVWELYLGSLDGKLPGLEIDAVVSPGVV